MQAFEGGLVRRPRLATGTSAQDRQQFAIARILHRLQRADQRLLDRRHIAAEREQRQQPLAPRRAQRRLDRVARVVARCGRQRERALELTRGHRLRLQLGLELAVGNRDNGCDRVAVGAATDIGDAVLGDEDVAQRTRHRRVGVAPDDVGDRAAVLPARAADGQNRARALELVRHVDEVVLAADAGDDAAVVQRIRGDGAEQRGGQRSVDEAGVPAFGAFARGVAVERVGIRDRAHHDLGEAGGRHLAQLAIEGSVADEKTRMQQCRAALGRRHAAGENTGTPQGQETVDQHFRAAVEAGLERRQFGFRKQRCAELFEQPAESPVVGVAQDQRVGERVRERADADLQRAAVPDQGRGVERHCIVGERHRLLRRREQLMVRRCRRKQQVEVVPRHFCGGARHVGHVIVDLGCNGNRLASLAAGLDVARHVEGQVGIRAKAQARRSGIAVRRHDLRQNVGLHALQMSRHVGVIQADVALLHWSRAEPGAGLQEEFVDADVRRQPVLAQCRHVERFRVGWKQALQQRPGKTGLERAAKTRAGQCQPGEDRKLQAGVALDQAIERVEQQHRLADADRHGDADVGADAIGDGSGGRVSIVEFQGHVGTSCAGAKRETCPLPVLSAIPRDWLAQAAGPPGTAAVPAAGRCGRKG